MNSVEFHGVTRSLSAPDGWDDKAARCDSLFVRDGLIGTLRTMESVWRLTPEERFAIACGANISLLIVGQVHPPVALSITDVKVLDDSPSG
jgi:hypothetical protein